MSKYVKDLMTGSIKKRLEGVGDALLVDVIGMEANDTVMLRKKLRDKNYRGQLSNSILAGIRDYFYTNPPPDTQIAMDLRREPTRQVRHVVARGDTVSQIAERYNVSTAAIRRANKLSNDRIRIGQTLSIPIFAGG